MGWLLPDIPPIDYAAFPQLARSMLEQGQWLFTDGVGLHVCGPLLEVATGVRGVQHVPPQARETPDGGQHCVGMVGRDPSGCGEAIEEHA